MAPGTPGHGLHPLEREDPLGDPALRSDAVPRRPRVGELFDLRQRTDDPGKLVVHGLCERVEGTVVARARENQVVRRGSKRGAHRFAVLLDEPQVELGIPLRVVAKRRGEPEHEVVPRLVLEQQGPGLLEERGRIVDYADLHGSGGGEIRTHGPREEPTVFKTVPLDRSGTPPGDECS